METFDQDAFEADLKHTTFAEQRELTDAEFPRLDNLSAAWLFDFVLEPRVREQPECVYVPRPPRTAFATRDEEYGYRVAITGWNAMWQAGQLRPELFEARLPRQLSWLASRRGRNITLVPLITRGPRYETYAALYHLLPANTLERFGLPLVRLGVWPHWIDHHWTTRFLPRDFDEKLARAFAYHIWPHLGGGASRPRAFAGDESIHLLAHNLDFWLPYANEVAYSRLEALMGPVPNDSIAMLEEQRRLQSQAPSGVEVARPLKGGDIWCGLDESTEATEDLVDVADRRGKLRAILDAIRSHRVEEDFSPEWSYAREDFERKLYRKRAKVKVSFVEIDDTIPVNAPTSEVHEDLLWQDLFAMVSLKDKRVVVCLRSGVTKLGDIARVLGYANHSPISRALTRIRAKARSLLYGAS